MWITGMVSNVIVKKETLPTIPHQVNHSLAASSSTRRPSVSTGSITLHLGDTVIITLTAIQNGVQINRQMLQPAIITAGRMIPAAFAGSQHIQHIDVVITR